MNYEGKIIFKVNLQFKEILFCSCNLLNFQNALKIGILPPCIISICCQNAFIH